jgi:3-dehydroquinate synthase
MTREKVIPAVPERFILADSNTVRLLSEKADYVLPAGEESKVWARLEEILAAMLGADLSRDSTVVVVGGGVVADVGSLAASLYMRGARLILVPTTLLSMVDAALGGKTGVNFGGYKNLVGTFYPAEEVRIGIGFVESLPEREYRSGLAEVIKTGLLGDEEVVEILESRREAIADRDFEVLEEAVWRCILVKGAVVERDLREGGIRAHLNLGHTFAHALESVQGFGAWTHGEAVAWGIARAMELGVRLGVTEDEHADRVFRLLSQYGFRTELMPDAADSLVAAMRKDKKRQGPTMRFILQRDAQDTVIEEVEAEVIRAMLAGE